MHGRQREFGDFQTPHELASAITEFLGTRCGILPSTIVEPTCGAGSFIVAAAKAFPSASHIYGLDLNDRYVSQAVAAVAAVDKQRVTVQRQDFFAMDWRRFFSSLPGEVLVIGNPPWVTNSTLGCLKSNNLPQKSNFQGHKGFAAKTGKANFDISEWMLIRLLEALGSRRACVAMLCKTATARKTLRYGWLNGLKIGHCSIHAVDAQQHFGAAVVACLLIIHTGVAASACEAAVYPGLSFAMKTCSVGLAGKELVADVEEYRRFRDLDGIAYYRWRSGVKHDAAQVMEFSQGGHGFVNGLGEELAIEPTYLFPLLKSSDLANNRLSPDRWVLLTQRCPGDETASIKACAPKTWEYLLRHADALDKRRSIIYERRPRFSVFGVGEYTFGPWKVAVSGLYKTCKFQVLGTWAGKPIVVDDTCYFVSCRLQKEARFVCDLLNSDVCQRFLRSIVFPDAKRPVTVDVLNRIDLNRLAERLGRQEEAQRYLSRASAAEKDQLLMVMEDTAAYPFKGRRPRAQLRLHVP
ncbi:MAG: N-6 DNA methylase [Planctomycetota bacterium]|nr:N-6 DNA methylase [Planctomycetota bacterium]